MTFRPMAMGQIHARRWNDATRSANILIAVSGPRPISANLQSGCVFGMGMLAVTVGARDSRELWTAGVIRVGVFAKLAFFLLCAAVNGRRTAAVIACAVNGSRRGASVSQGDLSSSDRLQRSVTGADDERLELVRNERVFRDIGDK